MSAPGPLVVGYGNTLRGDDGAGQVAALLVEQAAGGRAKVIACHQLMPELAPTLAAASLVIFVDAAAGEPAGRVSVTRLDEEAPPAAGFTHHLTPATLLTLAGQLYGHRPPAYAVNVTGAWFELSEELSPEVRRALPAIVAEVLRLIG